MIFSRAMRYTCIPVDHHAFVELRVRGNKQVQQQIASGGGLKSYHPFTEVKEYRLPRRQSGKEKKNGFYHLEKVG